MTNIALISLYGAENIGIRSMSAVLNQAGFNTSLIFFKRWVNNDIRPPSDKEKQLLIRLLRQLNIDLVGLSFTSPFLKIAQELTRSIKQVLPVTVAWGGNHATVQPQECLKYCDIAVRGEGEYAMLELARTWPQPAAESKIQNTCYQHNNQSISQAMRPLIQDLDQLPFPDYAGNNIFFIEQKLYNQDPLINARELRVLSSRGCPFNCSYCYNSILRKIYSGQTYHRIKKVETVLSELEYLLGRLKMVRKIKFDDDSFAFPQDWLDEFCRKYKTRIGLPFEILLNAECLDQQALKNLKSCGLNKVQLGIQTGSKQESQAIYNRTFSKEAIQRFALTAGELKLAVVYDVILDNPLASSNDKEQLIDLLLSLPRPFNLFIYSLTVFPGTELSRLFLEKGLILPEQIEGQATKSFKQFRLSLGYPRNKQELFYACIVSLTSKSFLAKSFIIRLNRNRFLKQHPLPLKWFSEICNYLKLIAVAAAMFKQGSLSLWKLKEYALPKRTLIQ